MIDYSGLIKRIPELEFIDESAVRRVINYLKIPLDLTDVYERIQVHFPDSNITYGLIEKIKYDAAVTRYVRLYSRAIVKEEYGKAMMGVDRNMEDMDRLIKNMVNRIQTDPLADMKDTAEVIAKTVQLKLKINEAYVKNVDMEAVSLRQNDIDYRTNTTNHENAHTTTIDGSDGKGTHPNWDDSETS